MAYKIIETCIACDLCVPECPIDAIEPGDPIYIINDLCCDFEDCLAVCPVDAIVPVEDVDPGSGADRANGLNLHTLLEKNPALNQEP